MSVDRNPDDICLRNPGMWLSSVDSRVGGICRKGEIDPSSGLDARAALRFGGAGLEPRLGRPRWAAMEHTTFSYPLEESPNFSLHKVWERLLADR